MNSLSIASTRANRLIDVARQQLAEVESRVAAAAREVGRDPTAVNLVAVTKTFGEADILPVLEAGHRLYGENRVQEAMAKWPPLRLRFPNIELHLVGLLQSNKAREAVGLFDAIHSIDRPKIARAVAEEMNRQGRCLKLLVQVNTGEESQKAGVMPSEAHALVRQCREELKLDIAGLMCIPPMDEEPAIHFAFLAKLAREMGLSDLSMGMSGDFETAVQFGATYVRIGSAIFGARG
jgi:pyridoxal phosphate enzyme (YggS family)